MKPDDKGERCPVCRRWAFYTIDIKHTKKCTVGKEMRARARAIRGKA